MTLVPTAPTGVRPALPAARGPVSAAMLALLSGSTHPPAPADASSVAAPFGEDLQLALYVAYELHYRGFAGVPDDREWDLDVLGLRAVLERRFLTALQDRTGADDDVESAVAGLLAPTGDGGAGAYLARHGTCAQLRELLVHRSLYHLKEADPQAFVLPRLDGPAKAGVAAVEFDEYGAGRAGRMHSVLFAGMMTEFGLTDRYGAYLDLVPAPMLAVVNLMSLCGLHRARRGALLGQLAAVEITSPPGAARLVAAVRRLGGGPAAAEFYAEHVVADSVHEHVMRRDVLGGLLDAEPELAADVVFGIRATGLLEDRLDTHLLGAWRDRRTSLRRPLTDTRSAVTGPHPDRRLRWLPSHSG